MGLPSPKYDITTPQHVKGEHASSGCFAGESLVITTNRGEIPISELRVGETVLSHCIHGN
ncbi:Uncharacterized protein FKW44_015353, partial [Caligus rogercresseyi]